MRITQEPRAILYTGVIVLATMALVATIAFGRLADHDPVAGIVLIAGFAFMGIVAVIRTNEKYWPSAVKSKNSEEDEVGNEEDDWSGGGRLGREGFGGPGNPNPLLLSILILQAAIIVISAVTLFDAQAWVFVFYFMGMDFALWVIVKAQSDMAAKSESDGSSPVSQ